MKKIKYATLVYQAGIANVFAVDALNMADYGRNARRLLQADFRSCAMFAKGLQAAGVTVRTLACNMSGDIALQPWTDNLDKQPWSEKFVRF